MTAEDIRKTLALVAVGHPDAAPLVHKLADDLRALALRLEANTNNPYSAPSGMTDKVRMKVVGPDGSVKRDTNPEGEL